MDNKFDWKTYINNYEDLRNAGINTKEKNFIEKHLAELNPSFAEQLKDFKEGNLLFEIMDKKIWSKSSNDLTGLKQFYQANKNNYNWKQSVQAIIITVPDNTTAEKIRTAYLVEKSIENIKKNYSEIALIDTGRYEASDLIGIGSQNAQSGYVSSITTNESDKSSTFVIVSTIFRKSFSFKVNPYL
jgi:peptidyl-prolyl cis-trans isomerase SurA